MRQGRARCICDFVRNAYNVRCCLSSWIVEKATSIYCCRWAASRQWHTVGHWSIILQKEEPRDAKSVKGKAGPLYSFRQWKSTAATRSSVACTDFPLSPLSSVTPQARRNSFLTVVFIFARRANCAEIGTVAKGNRLAHQAESAEGEAVRLRPTQGLGISMHLSNRQQRPCLHTCSPIACLSQRPLLPSRFLPDGPTACQEQLVLRGGRFADGHAGAPA